MSDEANRADDSEPAPPPAPQATAASEPTVKEAVGGHVAAPPAGDAAASEGVGSAEPAGEAPRKRRKKKRKAEPELTTGPAVFERPERDALGRERPRFLLRFPVDPELEPLLEAFESGNYARVRERAPELATRAERPEVRRAAEELLRRIEPDPLMKTLLAIAVAVLLAIASYSYLSAS